MGSMLSEDKGEGSWIKKPLLHGLEAGLRVVPRAGLSGGT